MIQVQDNIEMTQPALINSLKRLTRARFSPITVPNYHPASLLTAHATHSSLSPTASHLTRKHYPDAVKCQRETSEAIDPTFSEMDRGPRHRLPGGNVITLPLVNLAIAICRVFPILCVYCECC